MFIPGNTMVENVRALAWSALPDAPVEPDAPPGRLARLRTAIRLRGKESRSTPAPVAVICSPAR